MFLKRWRPLPVKRDHPKRCPPQATLSLLITPAHSSWFLFPLWEDGSVIFTGVDWTLVKNSVVQPRPRGRRQQRSSHTYSAAAALGACTRLTCPAAQAPGAAPSSTLPGTTPTRNPGLWSASTWEAGKDERPAREGSGGEAGREPEAWGDSEVNSPAPGPRPCPSPPPPLSLYTKSYSPTKTTSPLPFQFLSLRQQHVCF